MSTLNSQVFGHYGYECQCCGSIQNPSIDHVNGDGKEHREQIGKSSSSLYRWLVINGFPDGYQTLCRSCNASKQTNPFCSIHQRDKLLAWEIDHDIRRCFHCRGKIYDAGQRRFCREQQFSDEEAYMSCEEECRVWGAMDRRTRVTAVSQESVMRLN